MGSLKLGKYGALQGLGQGISDVGQHYLKAGENEKDREHQNELRQMLIDARQRENALDRTQYETEADRRHDDAMARLDADTAWQNETRKDREKRAERDALYQRDMLGLGERELAADTEHKRDKRAIDRAEIDARLAIAGVEANAAQGKEMRERLIITREDGENGRVTIAEVEGSREGPWQQQRTSGGVDATVWIPAVIEPEQFAKYAFKNKSDTRFKNAQDFDLEDFKPGGGREQARDWSIRYYKKAEDTFIRNIHGLGPAARREEEAAFKSIMHYLPRDYELRKPFLGGTDPQEPEPTQSMVRPENLSSPQDQSVAPPTAAPAPASPLGAAKERVSLKASKRGSGGPRREIFGWNVQPPMGPEPPPAPPASQRRSWQR